MLRSIIRHEWRTLAADRTLWLVSALFLGVVGYGVLNGVTWTGFQERTLAELSVTEQERLAGLRANLEEMQRAGIRSGGFSDPGDPGAVGGQGVRNAVLPPASLAAFSVGQSDLLPYYVRVSTRDDARAIFRNGEMENPTNLLSGRFDLAFVIVFLLPLVILALSYNLLSGEREAGTLPLVLSHPVSLRTLLAGKLAFRFVLVCGLVVGLAALAVLVLGTGQGDSLPRFLLWSAVVLVYSAFWFAVAVVVDSLGRTPAFNATAVVALWLALVLIAPALIHASATAMHPVPSRVEMIQAMRLASDEANAAGSQILAQYFQDHPEMADLAGSGGGNEFWVQSFAVQAEITRQTAPVQGLFDRQLARQQALVDRWRFLSPAVLAQEALNDVSGTGAGRFRHFREQAESFHTEYVDFFMSRAMAGQRFRPDDYENFPAYEYTPEPLRAAVTRVGISLAGIGVPAVVFLLIGFGLLRTERLTR